MYGVIEVTVKSAKMPVAISQIESVRINQGTPGAMINCGQSTYLVDQSYEDIMHLIRAKIIQLIKTQEVQ